MSWPGPAREPLTFWKMSGAGNDFIVLPITPAEVPGGPVDFVRRVCERGISVGADGVLFVTPLTPGAAPPDAGLRERAPRREPGPELAPEPPQPAVAGQGDSSFSIAAPAGDARLIHYNSDGGRSDFCGNGTRCAARFAVLQGFARTSLFLKTDAGVLRAEVMDERVRIEVPPCSAPVATRLETGGTTHDGWFVLAGVPHFVLQVDDLAAVDVARLGAALRGHPGLGVAGANIDFVEAGLNGKVMLRTFERGVEGETLACGSGAIAVAMVLGREGRRSPIAITPRSGIDLTVEFDGRPLAPERLKLTGEALVVFEGRLQPEGLGGGRRT